MKRRRVKLTCNRADQRSSALPLFSADDMNMTAMSKRPTLARLRSTSSATAGPSLLQQQQCWMYDLHTLAVKHACALKNSLQIEVSQSHQDLLEHVRFQPVVENGSVLFRLDLLQDIKTRLDHQIISLVAILSENKVIWKCRNKYLTPISCSSLWRGVIQVTAGFAHPQISVNHFGLLSNLV